MKAYRLIFIAAIVTILFLSGCKKPEVEPVSKRVRKKEIDLSQREAQEARTLLEELKKKNPFRADHFSDMVKIAGNTDLKGITWDSAKPFAIIGNKVVIEGDSIDGKKVIKINKDSVVLEEAGREIILKLD